MQRPILAVLLLGAAALAQPGPERIVGMYVHQHWPYRHPYAARTWTLDDWKGYAGGLKQLGFNTILVWPVLETMPEPLTPSDRASLEKMAAVIRMLHRNLGMRAWLVLCPNVAADNRAAAKATFEERHFFHSDIRVNPADPRAMASMMRWRERLLRPLAAAGAVVIIDSDPGGYPGSTNAEFVNLLAEHRKMLNRLRPGIELVYWMHFGWESYSGMYRTGRRVPAGERERLDVLTRLRRLNPEPWGVANGLEWAGKLGLSSRVLEFNYGRIEAEPSFPMTNYSPEAAWDAGRGFGAPRGVMANAQTHCLQLPNTFAFARGAAGRPVTEADVLAFAEDLVPGQGGTILHAWKAVAGEDAAAMRDAAGRIGNSAPERWRGGRLGGLLFGDPSRFASDLIMQLRMKAAWQDFLSAQAAGRDPLPAFRSFVAAAEAWQGRHGYLNHWRATPQHWRTLEEALDRLNSPAIRAVLHPQWSEPPGFARVREQFALYETHTRRLLDAMRLAAR